MRMAYLHLECRSECGLRANFQSGSCHRKECEYLRVKTETTPNDFVDVNKMVNKEEI